MTVCEFTDPERISLAKVAKPLGCSILADIATLVTPDTLLRWHRKFIERKTPSPPSVIGRPPADAVVMDLVLRFTRENPS